MASTLIANGTIVTATDTYTADVLVEEGRIRMIGSDLPRPADATVHDARGQLILPGGIDPHTHLDADLGPSHTVDTFESGTRAAAFGGTTTLVDYSIQTPGQPLIAGLADWRRRAESACVDVATHIIVREVTVQTLAEMEQLIRREGVTSFKIFMAYPGMVMVDDPALFRVLRVAGRHGAMVCVHAENGLVMQTLVEEALARGERAPRYHATTRPALLEGEAANRALKLAELAEAPIYLVHVSSADALHPLVEARGRGMRAYGETCPHYLVLTDAEYERPGFEAARYVMTPPLRPRGHQEVLWTALRAGQLDVVSTDHCAYTFEDEPYGRRSSKQQGRDDFSKIPNGVPGIETRLSLVHDGGVRSRGMSLNRFVEVTSTAPARLFGLFPRKGTIAVGSDADLVLFDPAEHWTIHAAEGHGRTDYSIFEGHEVAGRVKKVWLRGELIVDGLRWLGKAGMGQFVPRAECGRP